MIYYTGKETLKRFVHFIVIHHLHPHIIYFLFLVWPPGIPRRSATDFPGAASHISVLFTTRLLVNINGVLKVHLFANG